MKALLLSLLVSFPASPSAWAGDKIGNGGGLWVCQQGTGQQTGMLVDFFELEAETKWRLARPRSSQPFEIVDDVMAKVRSWLPDYASRWASVLQETKSRIHISMVELKVIEDSLWRSRPHPSFCRSGWEYVQFANYNDTLRKVLVRKDLWESNSISANDKAGLIWHEVIYRWMREQFQEKDSVRARQITGILFADLTPEETRQALADVLKQGPIDPTPEKPVFVCLVPNPHTNRWFYDYADSQLAARNQTLEKCRREPQGFFCEESRASCESFMTAEHKFTCAVENRHLNKTFTETGRSRLEAEAKARAACGEGEGAFFCAADVVCR